MANLDISHTADYIKVVANDLAGSIQYHTKYYSRTDLKSISLAEDQSYVQIMMRDRTDYKFSFDGSEGTRQVDTVNTVAPSSNANLASLLSNCMAI